jgi:hypothetical protein
MSHHYSGPNFGFPHGDARLNLTDLYAFPKPGGAGKSILIMNVHPSTSLIPPGPTAADPFAPDAIYELKMTLTAMPSPISRTGSVSRPPSAGRRPRRYAALRERKPPGQKTPDRLSSKGRLFRGGWKRG